MGGSGDRSDLQLWFLLLTFGGASLVVAYQQLVAVREAARVTKEEKPPDIICQRTEDTIAAETLGELAQSSNFDIRAASIRILSERATSDDIFGSLMIDLKSRHLEVRERAVNTIAFLYWTPARDAVLAFSTCVALIDLLVEFLPVARLRPHHKDTDYHQRTKIEREAITLLSFIVRQRLYTALEAGIVSRWLAHYPFGGPDLVMTKGRWNLWTNRTRRQLRRNVINRLKTEQTDDDPLGRILSWIESERAGRRELREFGLTVSPEPEAMSWPPEIGGAGLDDSPQGFPRRRSREESEEEAALRRRRRQAMVISEGGMPFSEDNIY